MLRNVFLKIVEKIKENIMKKVIEGIQEDTDNDVNGVDKKYIQPSFLWQNVWKNIK